MQSCKSVWRIGDVGPDRAAEDSRLGLVSEAFNSRDGLESGSDSGRLVQRMPPNVKAPPTTSAS